LEERIKRVMKRDKVDREKVEARIKNQLPDAEKEKKANFTILNTNLGKTAETVAKIHEILLNKSIKQ
jgi:dephospho-CoA kinase